MASIVRAEHTATISTSEYFLVSNSTSKVDQTNDNDVQVVVDAITALAGDSFRLRIYDEANGGSQLVLYEAWIIGPLTAAVVHPPVPIRVGQAWEVSLLKVTGTDRSIKWSVRQLNTDNASGVALSSAGVTAAQAGLATAVNQALTLAAVSNIAVTGAALNATTSSQTVTTGTDTGGVANTTQADGTYDSVADTAGTLEFYYEFDVSTTSGAVGVGVDWLGYVVGLVNTIKVFARNWNASTWEQVGSIVGTAGTANMSEAWELTNAHTSAGLVRIRFQATGLTSASVKTDRILLGYAVVPPTAAAIQSGLATSTALATAQTAITDIQTDVDELQTTAGTLATTTALSTAQTTLTNLAVSVAAIPTTPALATALATAQTAISDIQTDVDELQSTAAALATATDLATAQLGITAIQAKTDNLPSDPADESLIITATTAIMTALGAIPTTPALAADLATLQGDVTDISGRIPAALDGNGSIQAALTGLPDGIITSDSFADSAASKVVDAINAFVEEAAPAGATTHLQRKRIMWSILSGIARGLAINVSGSEGFRDGADSKDRATFDLLPDGTRTPGTFDGD